MISVSNFIKRQKLRFRQCREAQDCEDKATTLYHEDAESPEQFLDAFNFPCPPNCTFEGGSGDDRLHRALVAIAISEIKSQNSLHCDSVYPTATHVKV